MSITRPRLRQLLRNCLGRGRVDVELESGLILMRG